MNLSLLTADAYSLIVGVVLFQYEPSALYFVSLAAIVAGLLLYNFAPPPRAAVEEVSEGGGQGEAATLT